MQSTAPRSFGYGRHGAQGAWMDAEQRREALLVGGALARSRGIVGRSEIHSLVAVGGVLARRRGVGGPLCRVCGERESQTAAHEIEVRLTTLPLARSGHGV